MTARRSMSLAFYQQAKRLELLAKLGKARPHKVDASDPLIMCYSDPRQKIVMVGPVLKSNIQVTE